MTSTARPSLLYVFVSNYNAAIIRSNYTNPIRRGNVLVASVCMYVCVFICMQYDNFQKPRLGSLFCGDTGQVRIWLLGKGQRHMSKKAVFPQCKTSVINSCGFKEDRAG